MPCLWFGYFTHELVPNNTLDFHIHGAVFLSFSGPEGLAHAYEELQVILISRELIYLWLRIRAQAMSTPLPVSSLSSPAGTNTTVPPLAATTTSAFPLPSASSGSPPRTISAEAVVVRVGVAVVVGVGLLLIRFKKKGWRLCSTSSSNDLGVSGSHFPFDALEKSTNGFSGANLLGEGSFGHVYRGVLSTGKDVAVKRLKVGSVQGEREFLTEVEIISRVHHKHVVSLVGYCTTGSERILVYELVPNKTLAFHLHGNPVSQQLASKPWESESKTHDYSTPGEEQPTLNWPSRLKIALGAAEGLAYLHEGCDPIIIHRDIKAANILVDLEFKAKIADFGLAKFTPDANSHVSNNVKGTIGYLDPEYLSSGNSTEKSDVFSFGVVLLELITGRRAMNMGVSLVNSVRPQLTRYLEDGKFDSLVDPGLQNYDRVEMARMVRCAAACVLPSGECRPKMSKIVRALEGDLPLSDLIGGMKCGPGNRQTRGRGLLRLWSRPRKVQKDARTRQQPGSSSAGLSRPIAQDLEMGRM
ncbi:proline-rich receptor-like protein kinase PERK1 isoform X3 [Eucalyptus grandis]|uniref:proline-rich receptor-like protein kinase PERK1 isoform X3 n=1 Tax=Eucalyptus grandis TaxID=71139 RepID=UPI00192EEEE6|nr:proline-rich receptor-like protein kinase PERK1 isoform X3 [Eucalyptus grandis]